MARGRILIIDDNIHAADCLALVLSRWGYEVRVAYDGPPGLDAALEFRPQTVFVDIELPTLDGFEVARALRALGGDEGLRLVAVTGHDVGDLPALRDSGGFDEVLTKPLDFATLERLLERLGEREPRPAVAPGA